VDTGSASAEQSSDSWSKAFRPPAVSLPKGGGAIRGIGETFAVNPATGTASLSIPIATSPGRAGFGPQLSLSYDSGAGNGPFGLGWDLGAPSITRKTDKGLPTYRDTEESDEFVLSGAEDLVPALVETSDGWVHDTSSRVAGGASYVIERYRPRTEGLFARIERWTNRADAGDSFWRTISRDNVTSWYGRTSESHIADPADPARIFSWLLCEKHDDKGNAASYAYSAEDSAGVDLSQPHERNRTAQGRSAQRYLKRVRYGNRVAYRPELSPNGPLPVPDGDWLFEVVFDFGEHNREQPTPDAGSSWPVRTDPFSRYRAGFEIRTYRRCERVLVFHRFDELGDEPYLVRSTDLTYDDSSAVFSLLSSVTQTGYRRREDGSNLARAIPPLEFTYSRAVIDEQVREVDPASVEPLGDGLGGARSQWVDLDGGGVAGILSERGGGWFYQDNLSPAAPADASAATFGPVQQLSQRPSLGDLSTGAAQFMDFEGDGELDLAVLQRPVAGFYERDPDGTWDNFVAFDTLPVLDWSDPNLRLVDLTGDGRADVLVTEGDSLCWYASLGESGFGAAQRLPKARDEEQGPDVVFDDGTGSTHVADISGDGLADIVRVRNGEVCYWPNLGYGRFGPKVTMDDAPWFDPPDAFEPRRIRFADIDGSGVADIVYLARDEVRLYFNESGNGWSTPTVLSAVPAVDDVASVSVTDLLGNGTACLTWSSPIAGAGRSSLRYVDLMGGNKPHLLITAVNNLGAETHLSYASSTRFYLADKLAGNPWVTKLPFPVHVVERVETVDRISGNRFVSRSAFHHGYFDGAEREFRGFGMVEQWDTETIAALAADDQAGASNIDASSHVPPVLTRTWFHTGVSMGRQGVSDFFAGTLDAADSGEYYREPGLTDAEAQALLLEDTVLPAGLTGTEEREACRALRGSMLRQEVYALDGSDREPHPYVVNEQNFTVQRVQPAADNRHAVFFTHPREALAYHYERAPSDPRVSHELTIDVDDFGNPRQAVKIGYGRRAPDSSLRTDDQAVQAQTFVIFSEHGYTNPVDLDDDYRTPLPAEGRTYEITGLQAPLAGARFGFVQVGEAVALTTPLAYEELPTADRLERRLIEHLRTRYRPDDLGRSAGDSLALLPVGVAESLALPGEAERLVFTPGLLSAVYGARVDDRMLIDEGGYVRDETDGSWWMPSGRMFYTPEAADPPETELRTAQRHFFLPRRFVDPFGAGTHVTLDPYDLMTIETRDPVGNVVVTVNEYRVLQRALVTDPNGNRSEVAFDALGMVVGTATMGKPGEDLGDTLAGFEADLPESEVLAHLADPLDDPHSVLHGATTRLVYDLFAYHRTRLDPQPTPGAVYAIVRETHESDLSAGESTKIQHACSYSDGFGREIQRKVRAEPGPLTRGGPDVNPRWIGSSWTVFNNKGKPVRQYEPFFSATHGFEVAPTEGVSAVLLYDPAGRVAATLHPNHTWEKAVFDAWREESWDVNDTVLIADPKDDPHVADYFRRLPDAHYLPGWHAQRTGGAMGPLEQAAAVKAAVHSSTSGIAHMDSLGRAFLTVAHNRFKHSSSPPDDPPEEAFHTAQIVFDIEGNKRDVIDALDRVVMRYDYDLVGNQIRSASMDAGERWTLNNVAGRPIYRWDSRDHRLRTAYDLWGRPTEVHLQTGTTPEALVARTVYGESQPSAEAHNLRGKPYQAFDGAGVVSTPDYDFKGNALSSSRQLAVDYKAAPDWSTAVALETEVFIAHTSLDALNRPVTVTTPDNSTIRPAYNEANLLDAIDANLRGETLNGQPAWKPYVTAIDYNAKGQRERIAYANGVATTYDYDPLTFRLIRLQTLRGNEALQDLSYTYDPMGNITNIEDDAQQTIYFRNKRVAPSSSYTYDATYRLIDARGREHLGQLNASTTPDAFNSFQTSLEHPGDGNAMGRYLERYVYDAVGNLLEMQHAGTDPAHAGWTRTYEYQEASLIELDKLSNRLSSTQVGDGLIEPYTYDTHGSMTSMPHLPLMRWDYLDQLGAAARQIVNGGTPETTWFVYDGAGKRTRKVTERQAATGELPARKDERVYLFGFEVYRAYGGDGTEVTLERETLHVTDDQQRIAMVETRTQGEDGSATQLIRYQFANHLGSANLETDEAGRLISYEEYCSYGSTSYQAVDSSIRAAGKRYRYTGKERDDETGLSYHGARYYAPWLGRWTSADPLEIGDGLDVYMYVSGNPVRLKDSTGLEDEEDAASEIVTNAVHGIKPGPINTSSVGTYQIQAAEIPFANALLRKSNPTKVPFPEEFGMHVSGDPTFPAWKHALEVIPDNPNSPWISATRNLEASSFRGTEYLIDADQLKTFIDHPELVQEVKNAVARGDYPIDIAQKWLTNQVSGHVEMEVLIKNDVPAEAIRRMDKLKTVLTTAEQLDMSSGLTALKTYGPRFARGANAVGAVMTVVDVASAAKESYDVGNPMPLAAEATRQAFAWGGGIVGTFAGAVTGAAVAGGGTASFTWETGPLGIGLTVASGGTGAVVGGVAGNVGGSFAGYSLGDWLADEYIYAN
jgi:RHS repeat-associated protein